MICEACQRSEHGTCRTCMCAVCEPPIGGVRAMDIGDVRPLFRLLNERFTNEYSGADTLADAILPKLQELLQCRAVRLLQLADVKEARRLADEALREVGMDFDAVFLDGWLGKDAAFAVPSKGAPIAERRAFRALCLWYLTTGEGL